MSPATPRGIPATGRLDLTTLKYEWLTDDIPWDVADVVVDPTTAHVAFTINEDGASRLSARRQETTAS